MIVVIVILLVFLLLFIYFTINLLKKNEKCEDIINSYQKHIQTTNLEIEEISKKLDKIDEKGTFKSDDEIGWFFNSVKGLRDRLLNFKVDL
jgi:hypothetical protein